MPYRLLTPAASRAGGRLGWARAAFGVAFAAVANHVPAEIAGAALPWLLAPVGASAVLVPALPASPLAQPWPVVGGSMVSALVGVTAAQWVPYPELACAAALGFAIVAMSNHPASIKAIRLAASGSSSAETAWLLDPAPASAPSRAQAPPGGCRHRKTTRGQRDFRRFSERLAESSDSRLGTTNID